MSVDIKKNIFELGLDLNIKNIQIKRQNGSYSKQKIEGKLKSIKNISGENSSCKTNSKSRAVNTHTENTTCMIFSHAWIKVSH